MAEKRHWCDCQDGPRPVVATIPGPRTTQFDVSRDLPDGRVFFLHDGVDCLVNEERLALEHIARISYTFWKPIVIPIDLTIKVEAGSR